MKKLLSIFSVIVIIVSLSACDYINMPEDSNVLEDIKEITSDLCTKNPDNELCQEEALVDFETNGVLDIFNGVLADYDTGQATFCADNFAPTNAVLFKTCEDNVDTLFPNDLDLFTYTSLEEIESHDTSKAFKIAYDNNVTFTRYEFIIIVTQIEDSFKIKEWSYASVNIDPISVSVPLEDAIEYYSKALLDYSNKEMESTAVCEIYFSAMPINDCVAARQLNVIQNATVSVHEYDIIENGVSITVAYIINGETDYQTDEISFAYDIDGNITFEFMNDYETDNSEIDIVNYRQQIQTIILLMHEGNVSFNDIVSNYLMGDTIDAMILTQLLSSSDSFTFALTATDDDYLLSITLLDNDEETNLYYIAQFDESDGKTLTNLTAKTFIEQDTFDVLDSYLNIFITDFNSFSKEPGTMSDYYFNNNVPDDLMNMYKQDILIDNYYLIQDEPQSDVFEVLFETNSRIFVYEIDITTVANDPVFTLTLIYADDENPPVSLSNLMGSFANEAFDDLDGAIIHYFDDDSIGFVINELQTLNVYQLRFSHFIKTPIGQSVYFYYDSYNGTTNGMLMLDMSYEGTLSQNTKFKVYNTTLQKQIALDVVSTFTLSLNEKAPSSFICDEFSIISSNTICSDLVNTIYTSSDSVSLRYFNNDYSKTYIIYDLLDENGSIVDQLLFNFTLVESTTQINYYYDYDFLDFESISLIDDIDLITPILEGIFIDFNDASVLTSVFCEVNSTYFNNCVELRPYVLDSMELGIEDIDNESDNYIFEVTLSMIYSNGETSSFGQFNIMFYENKNHDIIPLYTYYNLLEERETPEPNFERIIESQLYDLFDDYGNINSSNESLMNSHYNITFDSLLNRRSSDLGNDLMHINFTDLQKSDSIENLYTILVQFYFESYTEEVLYNVLLFVDEDYRLELYPVYELQTEEVMLTIDTIITLFNEDIYNTDLDQYFYNDFGSLLYDFMQANNYHLAITLENDDLRYASFIALDEDNTMVQSFFTEINIVTVDEDTTSILFDSRLTYDTNFMERYISILLNQYTNGDITLDELCGIVYCGNSIPETFTTISVEYLGISYHPWETEGDIFKLKYIIDGLEYSTYHLSIINYDTLVPEVVITYLGYISPIPENSPVVTASVAKDVLTDFMADVYNIDLSDQYLQDTYFNGMINEDITLGYRTSMELELFKSFVISVESIETIFDTSGEFHYFTAHITIAIGDDVDEGEFNVIIRQLENGNYYVDLIN